MHENSLEAKRKTEYVNRLIDAGVVDDKEACHILDFDYEIYEVHNKCMKRARDREEWREEVYKEDRMEGFVEGYIGRGYKDVDRIVAAGKADAKEACQLLKVDYYAYLARDSRTQ